MLTKLQKSLPSFKIFSERFQPMVKAQTNSRRSGRRSLQVWKTPTGCCIIRVYHNFRSSEPSSLPGHFDINKARELIAQKCFRELLRRDVESYVKGCNVCLTSKADLLMDLVTRLPISADGRSDSYDLISLLERLDDGFCDGIAYICGLER